MLLCGQTPFATSKATLPASAKLGHVTSQLGNIIIRITALWSKEQKEALFKQKAARYKTISAMIRDAVRQFDDTATHGKVKALKEMTALYRQYQQELSWLGGNFNQTVKRANELAIAEELTPQFFEQTLYPQVAEIQKLISSIKGELHDIAKEVSKL